MKNFFRAICESPRAVWWLVGTSTIYAVFGLINIVWPFTSLLYLQLVWIVMMSLPLWVKPIAKLLDMRVLWEK